MLVALPLLALQSGAGADDELRARLSATFEARAGSEFRGAVLVLSAGQPLLATARGIALGEEPITTQTYFDVGSIAKGFTAAAVLVLVQQEKLELGDSIDEHLEKVPKDKRAITVRHLLEHSSGLPGDVRYGTTREETVEAILSSPLRGTPGTEFSYSNGNYTLLAALVDRVADVPFERFVHEQVFAPAGLEDTLFVQEKGFDPARDSRRVTTRKDKPVELGTATYYAWGWGFRGSTGVVTTIEDLGRWCRALAAGKVLQLPLLAELWRAGPGNYACGWFVRELAPGLRQLEHGGSTPGFRAQLAFYPERDLVIAIAGDESSDIGLLFEALRAESLGLEQPKRASRDELELWCNARASLVPRAGEERRLGGCPDWIVKEPGKDGLIWCYVNPPVAKPESWLFGLYMRSGAARTTLGELERALAAVRGKPSAPDLHELILSVDEAEVESNGWVSFQEAGLELIGAAPGEGPDSGLVLLRLRRANGTFPVTFRLAPAVATRFARALRTASAGR
jgi:CubicO group peptidase (beta-lactamase class C family)